MANATRDQKGASAEGSSGDERSLTTRMLDLIHRFDAKERRKRQSSDAGDPMHQRRRDDEPPPAPSSHV
jgi:hypothetical protein